MSVTTRTNLATNPTAATVTNWAAVAGTGGTAALTNVTGTDAANGTHYNRVTWSAATTAISGGFTYTATGLSASTAYAVALSARPSKTQTLQVRVDFRNSSNTIVNTVTGTAAAVTANTWTVLSVTGTSGAAVTNAVITVQAVAGGSNWANGDKLDGDSLLIEQTTTVGSYFDGSMTAGGNIVYAWTGTADASTSTATTYQPTITVTTYSDTNPCPRAQVTISDLAPTDSTVNVWRTADGKRRAVRGARRFTVTGSDVVTDYELPLGRAVMFELEILDGVNAQAVVTSVTVNQASPNGLWWVQDPLDPTSAMPLARNRAQGTANTAPSLTAAAVKNLEYAADVTIIPIQGSNEPVALAGQRRLAGNVDFAMLTNTAQATTNLRNLLQQAPILLLRPPGIRNDGLPGLCYVPFAKPSEQPVTTAFGGTLTTWALSGDLVAPPTVNVVIPVWTYQNVANTWATYQQAQTAFSGKTYLDAKKSPTGV